MPKLFADFGVSALIAVIALIGSLVILGIGMMRGLIDPMWVAVIISGWGSSAISTYLVVKGVKTGQNNK